MPQKVHIVNVDGWMGKWVVDKLRKGESDMESINIYLGGNKGLRVATVHVTVWIYTDEEE